MNRHIFIHPKAITPIKFCDETVAMFYAKASIYEIPFEIQPTEGEHDFNSCENCQTFLSNISKFLQARFDGGEKFKPFPLCCEGHRNLAKFARFDRKDFLSVPEQTAKKIIYTNQHIVNGRKETDWFKRSADYIEYAVQSFGTVPENCGEPLFRSYFLKTVNNSKELTKEQKRRISEVLQHYLTPTKMVETDVNILVQTYEKWYKIFPFELNSYFGNLKEGFKKKLLIYDGIPEVNMYTGIAKAKLHTKTSLIETLINLTNKLLTEINAVTLYEKGLLSDANKIMLELIINSRKLKLKQGYNNSSQDEENRYRKIIKEWFNDEKKFIDEITPLLKPVSLKYTDKISAPALSLFCSIVHQSEVLIKGFDESNEKYCNRVCNTYHFRYSDRVRQGFSVTMQIKEADKNLRDVLTYILPKLPIEIKNRIQQYVANKTKLYG